MAGRIEIGRQLLGIFLSSDLKIGCIVCFLGENKNLNWFYLKNPLVEKQYQKYQTPVYYLANKIGYSIAQLYLAFVQNLNPHKQVHLYLSF